MPPIFQQIHFIIPKSHSSVNDIFLFDVFLSSILTFFMISDIISFEKLKPEQVLCVKCQKMGVEFLNEKPKGLRYNIPSAVLKIIICFFITAPAI